MQEVGVREEAGMLRTGLGEGNGRRRCVPETSDGGSVWMVLEVRKEMIMDYNVPYSLPRSYLNRTHRRRPREWLWPSRRCARKTGRCLVFYLGEEIR